VFILKAQWNTPTCGEHKIWIDGECRPQLFAIMRNIENNWKSGGKDTNATKEKGKL
jgi:hypothetical protein